jgi:hypothetical protein
VTVLRWPSRQPYARIVPAPRATWPVRAMAGQQGHEPGADYLVYPTAGAVVPPARISPNVPAAKPVTSG